MIKVASFISGLLFGLGLIASGMTNPAKVHGFLDLAGLWDPSLALVMCGAIGVGLIAFTFAKKRSTTLLGTKMFLPNATAIDRKLIVGNALFGAGWGLAGVCPGPALASILDLQPEVFIFLISMSVGMLAFEWSGKLSLKSATQAAGGLAGPGIAAQR